MVACQFAGSGRRAGPATDDVREVYGRIEDGGYRLNACKCTR
jgi:hypothetical protein